MAVSAVRLQNVDGFTSLISARAHTVLSDRTIERGGNDLGFSGVELLLAAQAGCFATTFIDAAKARGIAVRKLDVKATGETAGSPSRLISLRLDADIDADASNEEIEKLILIAERGCTVSNTLRAGLEVEVSRTAPAVAAD
jgi:putative redox protein